MEFRFYRISNLYRSEYDGCPQSTSLVSNVSLRCTVYDEITHSFCHSLSLGVPSVHCFDHVVAVIFVANISNYDESLEEDDTVNAMCDQIELFRDIVSQKSSRFFVILFLNKEDLFREKYWYVIR